MSFDHSTSIARFFNVGRDRWRRDENGQGGGESMLCHLWRRHSRTVRQRASMQTEALGLVLVPQLSGSYLPNID